MKTKWTLQSIQELLDNSENLIIDEDIAKRINIKMKKLKALKQETKDCLIRPAQYLKTKKSSPELKIVLDL